MLLLRLRYFWNARELDLAFRELARLHEKCPGNLRHDRRILAEARTLLDRVGWRHKMPSRRRVTSNRTKGE